VDGQASWEQATALFTAAALLDDAVDEFWLADRGEDPEAELARGTGRLGRRLEQSEGSDDGSRKLDVKRLLEPRWLNRG
jgi:hypothetical protein